MKTTRIRYKVDWKFVIPVLPLFISGSTGGNSTLFYTNYIDTSIQYRITLLLLMLAGLLTTIILIFFFKFEEENKGD